MFPFVESRNLFFLFFFHSFIIFPVKQLSNHDKKELKINYIKAQKWKEKIKKKTIKLKTGTIKSL